MKTPTAAPTAFAAAFSTSTIAPSATPRVTPQPSASATPMASPTDAPTATLTPLPPTPGPPPRVVGSYPIDGDHAIAADRPLIVDFDQPMDAASVTAHLIISPTLAGQMHWPTTQRLVFTPAEPWEAREYEVVLQAGAKSLAHGMLEETWRLRFAHGGRGVRIPVLMYHRLRELEEGASETAYTWSVSPEAFAAQMEYLVAHGWRSISPAQLAAYFQGAPLPAKPVLITMDDGYRDVYTVAYPVLKNMPLRPVLFIVPQYIGYGAYLDWAQLHELIDGGFFVGSHSMDHTSLRGLSEADLEYQLGASRDALEKHLGISIEAFCYPYGSYDQRTIAALARHGYTTAFTLNPTIWQSPARPYELGRLRIDYAMTLEQFAALLP